MAEENQVQQVTKEPQGEAAQAQQVTKELQRVTTKNPKKVEAGKRLAAHNRRRREEAQKGEGVNQYYSTGVVIAIGVIGGLGYYIYRTKRGEVQPQTQPNNPHKQPPQTNKFEMD